MSGIVHVIGDLTGLGATMGPFRRTKIDKKTVGKLTKLLGPLQAPTTVERALALVARVAGVGGELTIDEGAGTVAVRAVVTDHMLHDLAAPLIGAFRAAADHRGRGALLLVEGATDTPGFGHRLDVDGVGAAVRELKRAELGKKFAHPARAELEALERALEAAPPPVDDGYPDAMREVAFDARPIYRAAWDLLASADEATLLRAVASATAWHHPDLSASVALDRARAAASKDAILGVFAAREPGRWRAHLDDVFGVVPWIDAPKTIEIVRAGGPAGVWTRVLARTVRGLVASGVEDAETAAFEVFELASDDPETEIDLWQVEPGFAYAIGRSATSTADLVGRLDASLKKKTHASQQKRIVGLCCALAYRTDDADARAAVARAAANVPEKVAACVTHYAKQNGWTPP